MCANLEMRPIFVLTQWSSQAGQMMSFDPQTGSRRLRDKPMRLTQLRHWPCPAAVPLTYLIEPLTYDLLSFGVGHEAARVHHTPTRQRQGRS